MQIRCIIAKVLDKLVLELHYTLQYNATMGYYKIALLNVHFFVKLHNKSCRNAVFMQN